ncbi:universal stress protein [Nitrosopumilus piranensis]|uniref:UspA domain-containing protein n=1 Tax=Nitrosopumilus piranensis TaxID=1582439 RepID=A0A0C5CD30_9ARCH|nr:universal stress protein [Nitrosopumilus piranensis]AJM93102.1 hypothetical protein NPIRD3C_1892 [Nitrosopumilus piranensis]
MKIYPKHIMVPFRPSDVFFRAFDEAVTIAKQNNARITVVKVIDYRAGLGIDMMMAADILSRECDLHKFDGILTGLQKQAILSDVNLDVKIMDLHLSPAKAFVDFAYQNDVDMMVMGCIKKKGLTKHFRSDISDEIMDLSPPCNVVLVE